MESPRLHLGPSVPVAGAPCTWIEVVEGPRSLGFWVPDRVAERVRDHERLCGCAPGREEVAFLAGHAVTPTGDDLARAAGA